MAVTEIRPAHWARDTSDAVIEALEALQASEDPWGEWHLVPAYPAEDDTEDARQTILWVEYKRTVERLVSQGGRTSQEGSTVYKGFNARVEFEIGAKVTASSGWLNELLEVESAFTSQLIGPFGPPQSLVSLGMQNFTLEPEEERVPNVERSRFERVWFYQFLVAVEQAVT